jgi:hypothetical protein
MVTICGCITPDTEVNTSIKTPDDETIIETPDD